jgi:hypothetical protein
MIEYVFNCWIKFVNRRAIASISKKIIIEYVLVEVVAHLPSEVSRSAHSETAAMRTENGSDG